VAVSFIKENYDKPLTTKQMSLMVHLSEGYFCQVFKEVTGNTAMEYVNRVRIDKAEKMLKKTEMTITEIAFCCGFGDANYFSRMFKKLKGISPQSIRNKNLQ
jgi:AraC-like DNA-binding protein